MNSVLREACRKDRVEGLLPRRWSLSADDADHLILDQDNNESLVSGCDDLCGVAEGRNGVRLRRMVDVALG
jgi:hypothetical protein